MSSDIGSTIPQTETTRPTVGSPPLPRPDIFLTSGFTADGRATLCAIDRPGHLFLSSKAQQKVDAFWTGWTQMENAPADLSRVAVAQLPVNGAPQVVAIDAQGRIWTTWWRESSWVAEFPPFRGAPPDVSHVAAGQLSDGRPQLFAIDRSGRLWSSWKSSNQSWASWTGWVHQAVPASLRQIAAGPLSDKALQLYAVDDGGKLWTSWKVDSRADAPWSPWVQESTPFGAVGSITLAPLSDRRLMRIAVDAGRRLWTSAKSNTSRNASWTNWVQDPDARSVEQAAAVPLADGRLQIFLVCGHTIWTRWQDGAQSNAPWTSWRVHDNVARLTASELQALVTRYAPTVYLHSGEQYYMTSVEWYLQHSTLRSDSGVNIPHPSVADLPTSVVPGVTYWLEPAEKQGDLSAARAYVIAHDAFTATEIQYWFFYAYNGPGTLYAKTLLSSGGRASTAPLGEHYGDWECIKIVVDNASKRLVSANFVQHGDDHWIPIEQLERHNDQIVVYSSHNGHASYPHQGENHTEDHSERPLYEFYLCNDTDRGRMIDCSNRHTIVSAEFLDQSKPLQPRWLHYPYRWGPATSSTVLSFENVHRILQNALGTVLQIVIGPWLTPVAYALAAYFKKDDLNGPYGPKP